MLTILLLTTTVAFVTPSVQGAWPDFVTLDETSPQEVFPGESVPCQYTMVIAPGSEISSLNITQVTVFYADWGYTGVLFSGILEIKTFPYTRTFNHTVDIPSDLAPGPHSGTVRVTGSTEGDPYELTPSLDFTFVCASAALDVNVTSSVSTAQAPVDVALTADVTGGTAPYTYEWDFDDGTTGTGSSVNHVYAKAGTYSPEVIITDNYGRTVTNTSAGIVITPAFQVNITASTTAGTVPLNITFSATPRYGVSPYTYLWQFGDGSTSNEESPFHEYTDPATYNVKLNVTDSEGRTTTSPNLRIVASMTLDLKTSISSSVSYGMGPLDVSFYSVVENATGTISYNWTFGDGAYSEEEEPVHNYSEPGIYTVHLKVSDSSMKEATSQDIEITVTSEDGLEVIIQQGSSTGPAPLTVPFTSSVSSGTGPYFYHWNFDDGSTSTMRDVNHTYDNPGSYSVTLTVTDSSSRVSISNELTVVVGDAQWAPFSSETWIWVGWGVSILAVGLAVYLLIRFKW